MNHPSTAALMLARELGCSHENMNHTSTAALMLFNLHPKQFQYLYAMKFSEIIAVAFISVLCSFSAFSQEVELDHFSVFQHDDEVYLS